MPQGAQLTGQEAISGGMLDILWGASDMPGGTRGAAHLTEIGTDGQKEQGDTMRRIWREHGKGDLTRRGVDIPP